ncbi:MAG: hypothetical protein JNK82_36525 [Myxococcaceae bacterium]|nr:hypothetical protein [Myxococcaceae bacterium]
MAIDALNKLKTGVGKLLESEPVAKLKEVVAEKLPEAPAEAFQDTKAKLMSITGKAKAFVPTAVREDLKSFVAQARGFAGGGGGSMPVTAALVNAPAIPDEKNVKGLKEAIRGDSDTDIREAIIANPSALNDLTPEEKGKALKRLEEGVVSPGDAFAMKQIVNSCTTKEELQAVVAKATGNANPGQAEYHKFDQQIQKHCGDPYLIADKMNPLNLSLPSEQLVKIRTDAAKAAAAALDPNPAGSIHREQYAKHGGGFADKPLSVQKTEKEINLFVDEASARARLPDPGPQLLVQEAKTSAKGMSAEHGGDLLLRTADKLMAAGRPNEAKQLLQELKQEPYVNKGVDLAGAYSGGPNQTKAKNGNTVSVDGSISETLGAAAERRMAQIDQVATMEKTLGRKVDPYNVNDLRDYFSAVKKQGGMKAAGDEYNKFLNNFTKHPGGVNNSWEQNRADLDDPTKMAGHMKNQTRDASGRMLLDCEGTTWLTGQIFGGKPQSAGNEVWYTSGAGHIAATVIDPKTGEGFHVNTAKDLNSKLTQIPTPTPKTEAQRRETAWGMFSSNGKSAIPRSPPPGFKPGIDYSLTKNVAETELKKKD